MDFQTISYQKHSKEVHDNVQMQAWHETETVDYWRHERMYDTLLPFLEAYPGAQWLTLGDGRYGTDAHYLLSRGAKALATDLNDSSLKCAYESGFITSYQIENAESLSFEDNSFDFVLCKEAYHHFPRPMIALYEMIRVARIAVILIEPNDTQLINPYFLTLHSGFFWFKQSIKNTIKKWMGKAMYTPPANYENSGNYVFSISPREIEKVALGINLPSVAFKGLNDHYCEGVEFEKVADNGPLLKVLKEELDKSDALTEKKPEFSGLLIASIFKSDPIEACISKLHKTGFAYKPLPRNPHI